MSEHREHRDGSTDEELALLADLQLAGRLDGVPSEALAAAKASLAWRTLDAELADLVYDSVLDDQTLAGVRSVGTARSLTFESPQMTVEVETATAGDHRRLIGQLVPPQRGRVEVRHAGGVVTVDADEVGRFSVEELVPGPVSLRCMTEDGTLAVTTDWVLI